MYQQQRGNIPPGMHMPQPLQCQSDSQAREKLESLVYEYLSITGATKTAEAYKDEILSANPAFANIKPPEKGTSFLLDWWTVFWDLYCAAPERRDMGEGTYTAEAKYFHDGFIGNFQPPVMNGNFPHMGMTPEMMAAHSGAFPGRFPARMPPGAMPPAGFGMFPGDPRMARMPANSMRMPPTASFPVGAPGAMRPGAVPPMPGMPRYNEFMTGPGQAFPGASGSGMMPNGAIPPMSMSSPGMAPPGADPTVAGQPPFMGMPPGAMPASSSAMPFGMGDQSVGTPVSAPGSGTPIQAGTAPGSVPQPATTSVIDTPATTSIPGMPGSVGAPTSLVNGEETKPSPATTPRGGTGATGGTPAPGSVQSAAAGQPGTPLGGPLSQPPLSAGPPSTHTVDFKDDSEISKIKEGLLDGFKTEVSEPSYYA